MPRFRYKAYDTNGVLVDGELSVDSRHAALQALARKAQVAINLEEAAPSAELPWWQREIGGRRKLGAQALAGFTRELASLIGASLPIDEALRIIAVQPAMGRPIRLIVEGILERVTSGYSLSAALEACDGAFPEYYVRLVSAGEISGGLEAVLDDLARALEQTSERRSKILSQLLYPAVLLLAAIVALAVITTVLVPAVRPLFEDAQAELPAIIEILSGIEAFISANLLPLAALLVGLTAALIYAWRSPALKQRIDRQILRLPLAGTLVLQSETSRLARTLAALLRNGVPLTESIRIASGVMGNRYLAALVDGIRKEVEEGASFSAPLHRTGVFPDLFQRLARVGEETGQLDTMLVKVADAYDRAVQHRLERLMTLLTPVLTLLIGGLIGALVVSVMNAILSANALVLQ